MSISSSTGFKDAFFQQFSFGETLPPIQSPRNREPLIYSPDTCGSIESFTRSSRFNAFKREYAGVIDRIAAYVHGHAEWLDPSHLKEAKEGVTAGFAALKEHLFDLRADHCGPDKAQLYGTAKKQFHELEGLLSNELISHRQQMDAIVSLAGKARVGAGELMQGLEEAIAALKPPLIYSVEEHKEIADFIRSPKFDTFQKEYENVIDRITAFLHAHADQPAHNASKPDPSTSEPDPALFEKTEAKVMASFKKLKEHLFDSQGKFFGPHLPQVYGATKRLFYEFDDMLGNSRIPLEQRLTAIRNLAEPAEVCSGGLMTELEEAVAKLKRFNCGLKGAAHQWKIKMMNELILQHIKATHRYLRIEEVHYVNVYYNHLAEEMGVAPRQDKYVDIYKKWVSALQLEDCRKHVLSKFRPSLLATTLANEYRPRLERLLRENDILFEKSASARFEDSGIASQDSPEPAISFEKIKVLQNIQKNELDPEYGEVSPHAFLAAVDKNDYGSPQVYTGAQRPIKFARYFLKELKYAEWADYKSDKLVLSNTDEGRITMLDNLFWFKDKDGETREVTAERWLKMPPENLLANIEHAGLADAQARASLLRFIVDHVHDAMKAEKNQALTGDALDKWLSGFIHAMYRRKSMAPSWVTPVMQLAVAFNKISAVRNLVDAGCDINARFGDDRTMLMLAAMHGDAEMAHALIEKGADGKAIDKDGRNALALATLGDHAEVVNVLTGKRGNKGWYGNLRARRRLNATDKHGETVLMLAARTNKLAAMKALLQAGASKSATNENGQTALMLACREGKVEVAELLIENGAGKNIADKFGQTAMMHAAHNGEVETLKLLIAKGADKKAADALRQNALAWAAIGGKVEAVEALLDAGFDKNGKDRFNQTPLMHAAGNGRAEVVRFLLDQGADMNAKNDHGQTALLLAACSGSVDTARCFIEHGENGVHALMEVRQFVLGNDDTRAVEAARTLLRAGADGATALLELASQRSSSRLQYLVKAGADKHMDAQGKTALMRAVEMAAVSGESGKIGLRALKALLDAGADPEVRDRTGKSARMRAQELAARLGNNAILRAFDQAVTANVRPQGQQPQ